MFWYVFACKHPVSYIIDETNNWLKTNLSHQSIIFSGASSFLERPSITFSLMVNHLEISVKEIIFEILSRRISLVPLAPPSKRTLVILLLEGGAKGTSKILLLRISNIISFTLISSFSFAIINRERK